MDTRKSVTEQRVQSFANGRVVKRQASGKTVAYISDGDRHMATGR